MAGFLGAGVASAGAGHRALRGRAGAPWRCVRVRRRLAPRSPAGARDRDGRAAARAHAGAHGRPRRGRLGRHGPRRLGAGAGARRDRRPRRLPAPGRLRAVVAARRPRPARRLAGSGCARARSSSRSARRSAPARPRRWRSPCAWCPSPASWWRSRVAELAALALARRAPTARRAAAPAPPAAGDRDRHDRRRPDLLRGAGAPAVRRALRRHRPRAARRRRRVARRHRRAGRRAGGRAPVDARAAPRRARTASGWPTAPASRGAWSAATA